MSVSLLPGISIVDSNSTKLTDIPACILYLGVAYAKVTQSNIRAANQLLRGQLSGSAVIYEVTELHDDDIVSLLNNGLSAIVISENQLLVNKWISDLDPGRIILHVQGEDVKRPMAENKGIGLYFERPIATEFLTSVKESNFGDRKIYFSSASLDDEAVISLLTQNITPIIPANLLSLVEEKGRFNLPRLLLGNIVSDRSDGLFPTIVTDEGGVALGLVYSSRESFAECLRTGRGVYHSRKRGLWYKGESSGDIQELIRVRSDCDNDSLCITVRQLGKGFCHLGTATCFGEYRGLARLQKTLQSRKASAPPGSYTARLFNDPGLLNSKLLEEAHELAEASSAKDIAFEAADLLYFSLVKCLSNGVVLVDIEQNLDLKSKRISRRKGDAKPAYSAALNFADNQDHIAISKGSPAEESKDVDASTGGDQGGPIQLGERISMRRLYTARDDASTISQALQRPSQSMDEKIKNAVIPIIQEVKSKGDSALLHFTRKFDRAESLQTPTLQSPFPEQLMKLSSETIQAIDLSFDNIRRFHEAQKEEVPLKIDTMPGVTCSRFSRPIEKVGLYVPGGTAVLPSTAMMLGVPAMVAGCRQIVIASPPRPDGSVSPEIVYVAHKVGAESILLAGGAQAVAALAYGTETVPKVDKILGPGNQYVTAAKMFVSTDMNARVSIDMPAGPSELLVIADCTANPAFVASDLLSQAEHGVDSQVILLAVDLTEKQLGDIEEELDKQAKLLPRLNIIRESIKRSVTLVTRTIDEAIDLSNEYAPEHLSLQINEAENAVEKIQQAGSIFIGAWTPESVGDYSAGVNHSLPTCGYARQYSGVNLASFVKHITSSLVTEEGLRLIAPSVMRLAEVEQLEAHRQAVKLRISERKK